MRWPSSRRQRRLSLNQGLVADSSQVGQVKKCVVGYEIGTCAALGGFARRSIIGSIRCHFASFTTPASAKSIFAMLDSKDIGQPIELQFAEVDELMICYLDHGPNFQLGGILGSPSARRNSVQRHLHTFAREARVQTKRQCSAACVPITKVLPSRCPKHPVPPRILGHDRRVAAGLSDTEDNSDDPRGG